VAALQTSIMMWRQIFTFVQSAMLNILAHPWGVRIWAIAGARHNPSLQISSLIM
jgi:hypothetical protein